VGEEREWREEVFPAPNASACERGVKTKLRCQRGRHEEGGRNRRRKRTGILPWPHYESNKGRGTKGSRLVGRKDRIWIGDSGCGRDRKKKKREKRNG